MNEKDEGFAIGLIVTALAPFSAESRAALLEDALMILSNQTEGDRLYLSDTLRLARMMPDRDERKSLVDEGFKHIQDLADDA